MSPSWTLDTCCDTETTWFLAFYALYVALILLFWRRADKMLKPFKLLAVFCHEMSHGSAAWLTCGKIKSIAVYDSEAGLVSYTGGCKALTIPAGYVGNAFWGGAFVALSAHRIGATVAACIISVALLLALV